MKIQTTIGAAIATLALGATTLLAVWPGNAQPPVASSNDDGFATVQFGHQRGRGGNNGGPQGGRSGGQNRPQGEDGPPPPPPGCGGPCQNGRAVGRELGELLHEMNLTPAQQNAIRATMDSNRDAMDKLREQMRKLEEQTRSNINSALSATQRAQLQQAEQQLCESRGGHNGRPGGPPPRGGRPGGPPPRGPNGGPDDGGDDGYPGGTSGERNAPRGGRR